MINVKADFKISSKLDNLIKDCESLNFKVLETGNDGTLVQHIKDLEVTPKDTGYTEDCNEIVEQGYGRKALANTNQDYGGRIYRNGPDYGRFHNKSHPPYENEWAQKRWLENDIDPSMSLTDWTLYSIDGELRRKYGIEGDQIVTKPS